MKKIVFFTLILQIFTFIHAHAFDLDMTVDDEIRKNYNSSKLIKDTGIENLEPLPELPKSVVNKTTKQENKIQAPIQIITSGNTKIKKGTSFSVKNLSQISDWQQKGCSVTFKTSSTINKKKFTIPVGTVFNGEVIESHQPQITGNGGLVVIRIQSMDYKGQRYPVNAYITRADDKKIFLNNSKGERKDLKTMWQKGNWGRGIFNKMLTLTINLGASGSTLLLSPFPFTYGTICLGLNALTSPICAFFTRGGHVSIPANSDFRIKLLDDAFID